VDLLEMHMKNMFFPKRPVFHEKFMGMAAPASTETQRKETGVRIDADERHEHTETFRERYLQVTGFHQNPEKKASKQHLEDFFAGRTEEIGQIWRHLCPYREGCNISLYRSLMRM
jgi:hypothetical protein